MNDINKNAYELLQRGELDKGITHRCQQETVDEDESQILYFRPKMKAGASQLFHRHLRSELSMPRPTARHLKAP